MADAAPSHQSDVKTLPTADDVVVATVGYALKTRTPFSIMMGVASMVAWGALMLSWLFARSAKPRVEADAPNITTEQEER